MSATMMNKSSYASIQSLLGEKGDTKAFISTAELARMKVCPHSFHGLGWPC